jgi:hypothetical protein
MWTVKFDGVYSMLGAAGRIDVDPIAVMLGRRKVTSSGAGGSLEIREMLAFSAEHGIYPGGRVHHARLREHGAGAPGAGRRPVSFRHRPDQRNLTGRPNLVREL